jgi:hypothetical protein
VRQVTNSEDFAMALPKLRPVSAYPLPKPPAKKEMLLKNLQESRVGLMETRLFLHNFND